MPETLKHTPEGAEEFNYAEYEKRQEERRKFRKIYDGLPDSLKSFIEDNSNKMYDFESAVKLADYAHKFYEILKNEPATLKVLPKNKDEDIKKYSPQIGAIMEKEKFSGSAFSTICNEAYKLSLVERKGEIKL